MLGLFRSRQGNFFYSAILVAILGVGIDLAFTLLVTSQQERTIFSDVFPPLVDFWACAILFITAKQSVDRAKRSAIAWGMICLSIFSYAIGDTIWAILEIGLKEQPFPSLADGFYLAYYPLLLVGVLLLPNKPSAIGEKISKGLDIGIVMVASILGFWNFLLGPIILSNTASPLLEEAILLAYPVGDLVLLGSLLLIINNRSEQLSGTSALLLVAGFLATIVSDSIFSYQTLLNTYVSGTILDVGWVASVALIGLAGASQMTTIKTAKDPTDASRTNYESLSRLRAIVPYLPYLWLIAAYGLLIRGGQTQLPMSFMALAIGVAVIISLVIIRQIIALTTNSRLNLKLQKTMEKIQVQTAELERANFELNVEMIERKRIEEKLSYDALHDAMTGLANRILFLDRLGRAVEYTKRRAEYPFAVLFVDLDQFKVINDSLGHFKGDQLLSSVGTRLRECVRSSDTVARFGGDEFAVLLEITGDKNSALGVAKKIQEVLKPPFNLDRRVVHVTASIGVVKDLVGYEYPEEVLRDADIAMYQAKSLGKERFEVFHIDMRDQMYSRLLLENELREGVEKHQFQLYYQPIISLESNAVASLEVLVRWLHPGRGLLLPDEFLRVAEESGLILPLGEWILNEACSQLSEWHQAYPELQNVSINVNISNRQFSQPDFVEGVIKALQTSCLKADSLRLEITESVLIGNYAAANQVFNKLKNLGIQLQIDDFGSGYSALGYLQHFPISMIKIDKSFINEIGKGRRGVELIRAIVSMARELGMETVAEGIETNEQLSELKSLSCNFGQGFHLSKPLDKDAVEKLLEGYS